MSRPPLSNSNLPAARRGAAAAEDLSADRPGGETDAVLLASHPVESLVDEQVEAFELAREMDEGADFRQFLLPTDNPYATQVATELVRVDMEFSWERGVKRGVHDYQRALPELLADQAVLGPVAFEEFRLRRRAGEPVEATEYQRRLGVDIAHWPLVPPANTVARQAREPDDSEGALVSEVWSDALKLADQVLWFPEVGSQFLGFELERELGRGAFARVYLARQSELADRPVVLKVAAGNSLEPQHLARLQHTHIVPIYSVHREQELTAVCMPYLGSRTLADLMTTVRQRDPSRFSDQNLISTFLDRRDETRVVGSEPSEDKSALPAAGEPRVVAALSRTSDVDSVAWIVKCVAEGLSHAHQRGIIHRDLKPANILLTDEGLPMVLDFNLSADLIVHGPANLFAGGTFPYMSPEQLRVVAGGGHLDASADVFAVGVILFELLTGRRPFPDRQGPFDEVVASGIADRYQPRPSARSINPAVPPSLDAVVDRCLAPDRADRYASMEHVAEDLDRHLHHLPLQYAPNRSLVERGRKWLRRHPRVTSAGGVAVMAVAAVLVLAGSLWVRERRIERLQAERLFDQFRQGQPDLYMSLLVPRTEPQIIAEGLAAADAALGAYGILEEDQWQARATYEALPVEKRQQLDQQLAETLYLMARARAAMSREAAATPQREEYLQEARRYHQQACALFASGWLPQALHHQRAALGLGADQVTQPRASAGSPRGASSAAHHPASTFCAIDRYDEILRLLDEADYRQARPLLEELRDDRPTDPAPWLLLGDASAALGRLDQSEGCFTTAIALQSGSYVGYFHRGLCRFELQRYPEALLDFDRVVAMRPQFVGGFLNRALVYRALGRPQQAIADLTTALELGATQTRIYLVRAELRRVTGDVAGANADRQEGLTRVPTDELSWIARGVARLPENPEGALADFREALKINPNSTGGMRNCVHVLADRLHRPDEARQYLDRLLALDNSDAASLAGRAVLAARQGDRDAALADVQRLMRIAHDPQSLFQAACALSLTADEENQDLRRALTLLSQATLANPAWLARSRTDPDLEKLRATRGYATLVENAGRFGGREREEDAAHSPEVVLEDQGASLLE